MRFISALLSLSLILSSVAPASYGQNPDGKPTGGLIPIDFAKEARQPIRESLTVCNAFLSPADSGKNANRVDDGVGTLVADSHDPTDTEQALKLLISQNSREYLRKAQISLTGVGMRNTDEKRAEFEAMLARNGWDDLEIQVKVFDIPQTIVEKRGIQTAKDLWEHFRYYAPSLIGRDNKDFQIPLWSEMKQGLAATAAVEALNAVFVAAYTQANGIEASTAGKVLAIHFGILFAYTVFQRTLLNWIVRNGVVVKDSSPRWTKFAQRALGFTKSMWTSMPFVLNYYAAGTTFTGDIGTDLATFGLTQGPTVLIQAICYNTLISNGVGGWARSRQGEEKQNLARAAGSWVAAPFQVAIAALLTVAAFNLNPFFHQVIGPASLDLNMGQVYLFGFTVSGAIFFNWMHKNRPNLFDFSLDWYKNTRDWWDGLFGITPKLGG